MKAKIALGWLSVGVLLGTLSAHAANAADQKDLESYLATEIGMMGEAIAGCPAEAPSSSEEGWYFKRFWLRVRPKVGFTAAGAVKIEITPEVEMLWDRAYPEGWVTYKPA